MKKNSSPLPSDYQHADENDFKPIFLVGPPRSGTTMLAVILDRHSNIAIPPETQFFTEFVPLLSKVKQSFSRKEMVAAALNFKRIADLKPDFDIVYNRFKKYQKTNACLLRAILETYAEESGKLRAGEKSPMHIAHIPTIFTCYPYAKVICIIRDGRDVVRSLLKVAWAEPGNPRRFGIFCTQWSDLASMAIKYKQTYSQKRFILVKYEDILTNPISEITALTEFVGEKFEPCQLDPAIGSYVVPKWEQKWKGNASKTLNPNRIQAWRRDAAHEQIWAMNMMMGGMLKILNYGDVELTGCPFFTRFKIGISKIPYLKPVRPISLFGLRVLRLLKGSKVI
ncbi:sulfotransferase [Desulfococcaceae bacterium HSG9]|nr:sulfotransferase [Desulfococcaceae bacterium HSG9]